MGLEDASASSSSSPSDAPTSAPSDAPPADSPKSVKSEEKREAEADRARRRRKLEKLKNAKTEAELDEKMRQFLGVGDSDEPGAKVEQLVVTEPLEPGQLPGWPKPSEIAALEPELLKGLTETAGAVRGFIKPGDGDDQAGTVAAFAIVKSLEGDAGKALVHAWAPVLARYLPEWASTPWFGAVIGSGVVTAMIVKAVNEALDEYDAKQKAKKESAS